ncbi:MAG: 1,6-anhydro-N-acetylmuramyl-L-alanine amidase AmpD, partial [Endozoicomonadaceae bacterium]|nr:1,6-anhydro-N-acetylmuramyl-L-alanine amidase AmpD [Endozoicomonadaceae bacterium]
GEYGRGYIQQFFQNKLPVSADPSFATIKDLKVSAHLLIERDGKITQFVPFNLRAWHAGKSVWQGRENCNDYSIGIELEGTDTDAYTDIQYTQLGIVTALLLQEYPTLNRKNIVGHEHIAPQRKTDPGAAFVWEQYNKSIDIAIKKQGV